jgi:hypothetical protein
LKYHNSIKAMATIKTLTIMNPHANFGFRLDAQIRQGIEDQIYHNGTGHVNIKAFVVPDPA